MQLSRFVPAAVLAGLVAGSPVYALTVPYTEDFTGTTANWRQGPSGGASPTNLVTTGGPNGAGDNYITYDLTNAITTSTLGGTTIFRGQNDLTGGPASGGAFIGNWLASGVDTLSFYIRHSESTPQPLFFGVRLAPEDANSPAVSVLDPAFTVSTTDGWTKVTLDVRFSNPNVTTEAVNTRDQTLYNTVLSDVGKVQILARRSSSTVTGTVTVDLDKVSIAPEPASTALALTVLLPALVRRRRA